MNEINVTPYHKVFEKLKKNSKLNKKIQIYSLYNFNPLVLENFTQFFLSKKKINVKFIKSDYDQIDQEIFSSQFIKKAKNSRFLLIGSDINIKLFYSYNLINQYLENLKNNIREVLLRTNKIDNINIIFFNVSLLISSYYTSKKNFDKIQKKIKKFNEFLINLSLKNKNLIILDIDKIKTFIGSKNFYDVSNYYLSKTPYSEITNNYISFELTKIINAELNIRKKCLIVDLDNTLWGGVLGEEGVNGIDLGKTLNGENYKNFQKYLKVLQDRGVILAICSKNNLSDVKECFKNNPEMFLRLTDFSSFQINWDEKYLNANKIAKELNIGKDSIVFFDDSEFEREQMKKFNPSINTLDFPKDPKNFIQAVENSLYFYQNKETTEDKRKKSQYKMMGKVNRARVNAKNIDDFLKNLSMKLEISKINKFNFDRSVQLINKTNQFNLTTKRYSSAQLRNYLNSKNQLSLIAKVKDKYGDNGFTALVMCRKKNNSTWIIDNLLLSCRIFGRGIENILLIEVLKNLKQQNVKSVEGKFVQSDKNLMCKDFYTNNKFMKKSGFFLFDIKNLKELKNSYVKVKYLK
tara:strand:- start:20874 stop:22604 length:1731 start_codon:yes stop_codon:yes gene_type:complete